jgi:O-antigen/teichoic acid export membrane protein
LILIAPSQLTVTSAQTAWTTHVYSISKNSEAYIQSWKLMLNLIVRISLVMFVVTGLVIFAKKLNIIPYSFKYIEWLVALLPISALATSLLSIPNNLLVPSGNLGLISLISWFGTVLRITSGYLITRPYGYAGPAISTI